MGIKLLPVHSEISDKSVSINMALELARAIGLQPENPVSSEASAAEVSRGNHVIALIITGGTESIVKAIKAISRSMIIVYHGSFNSLPAALEAASEVSAPVIDVNEIDEIKAYIKAAQVSDKVSGSKAMLIGRPSPWLVHSGEPELLKRLGVDYEVIDLDKLVEEYHNQTISENEINQIMGRTGSEGVSRDDFSSAIRMEKAIRSVISSSGVSCFSIRCFDLIGRTSTTACLALSRLNDEGVTAGCEGDVSAMATMKVLSEISGRPSFMGNVAGINGDILLLAHCTSPTSILESFSYTTHFESGKGVGIKGRFYAGQEFTVARLDLKSGTLRAGVGTSEDVKWRSDLCRTQVMLKVPGASLLLEKPIGNHYVVTEGNHIAELKMYAYINSLAFEDINEHSQI